MCNQVFFTLSLLPRLLINYTTINIALGFEGGVDPWKEGGGGGGGNDTLTSR